MLSNFLFGRTVASQLQPAAIYQPIFNASTKRVGGLRFIKVGRLCVSFCITREYKAA